MPTKPTRGKKQFATQVEERLLGQFREYARSRGESLTEALERALRREMTYPPPPPVPVPIVPLPDGAPPARKRKKS